MSWAVYGTILRITAGFRRKFYSNRRDSECRNKLFVRIIKISSVFKEASKNFIFAFPRNENKKS
jgi:hypothetical protein